jgi:two-component system response regulator HydG/two-component system response regulator AtoC
MLALQPRRCAEWNDLLGESDPIRRVKEVIQRVAPTESTVLITGETGTGKELVAHLIHNLSARAKHPFVCVNCTAIPDTLLESELFGFEKGAFSGAVSRQDGKLKQANSGTVFLDEIGDMSVMAQAKVLRTIESHEIQPLGGASCSQLDIRVLAATHQDLEALAASRHFREDLLFRLSVVPVHLPPLRERRSDIPALVDRFIKELNFRHGRDVEGVSTAGVKFLMAQDWPGNVRQLKNVVEGAYVVCSSRLIDKADLTFLHWGVLHSGRVTTKLHSTDVRHSTANSDQVLSALQATHWNKSKAAQLLRTSRMTVYRKIAKYGIHKVCDDVARGTTVMLSTKANRGAA